MEENRNQKTDSYGEVHRPDTVEHTKAAIEAVLFAMGDSLELSKIAKAIGHDTETTRKVLQNMMDDYQKEDRGIRIIELENAYQLCTKQEYYEYLVNIALQPKKAVLSDVMMETLSIIAYKQPVTKIEIEKIRGLYTPFKLGLAAAFACSAFTFLLGGGLIEMICAFIGAGAGQYLRARLIRKHYTLYMCTILSVALACLVYIGALRLGQLFFHISSGHEAGYICAMLFIIPGFPFITSGIDLAKLDMRSGLERLAYAVLIIVNATLTAWVMSSIMGLHPADFPELSIPPAIHLLLRLAASFVGVFGFSIMFNSPVRMAASAAVIGAIANTLRLELVDFADFPAAVAAFVGALTAGLLASALMKRLGYPRISVTVPSIVIMVPGLYLYRAVYNIGEMSLTLSAPWLVSALLIIMMLPLGLIVARIITDRSFRHCT